MIVVRSQLEYFNTATLTLATVFPYPDEIFSLFFLSPPRSIYLLFILNCRRKSESDADGSGDAEIGDISERTRSAVQRQKKAASGPCGKDDKCTGDRKNAAGYSPAKVRKVSSRQFRPSDLFRIKSVSLYPLITMLRI